jgi:predicted nucleotidyltransferase
MRRERLAGAELERWLDEVTGALVRRLSPERVILFGSFARGDQNRASDLDLVVIAPTALPFCERIGTALEACHATGVPLPVEVLVYTPEEWDRMVAEGRSFAALMSREGRVLHERRSERDRGGAVAQAGPA